MWDLPRPGLEPVSPALAGGFLTTVPPGKPPNGGFLPGVFICSSSPSFASLFVPKPRPKVCSPRGDRPVEVTTVYFHFYSLLESMDLVSTPISWERATLNSSCHSWLTDWLYISNAKLCIFKYFCVWFRSDRKRESLLVVLSSLKNKKYPSRSV